MNPKMSKIKGSNSNELRQKSGSGKASSRTSWINSTSIYEEAVDQFEALGNINPQICVHENVYQLCQQCEIRIRNQDIIDRIDYITNDNTYPISVKQNKTGHTDFEIELPAYLPLYKIVEEFPLALTHSTHVSICLNEGY